MVIRTSSRKSAWNMLEHTHRKVRLTHTLHWCSVAALRTPRLEFERPPEISYKHSRPKRDLEVLHDLLRGAINAALT